MTKPVDLEELKRLVSDWLMLPPAQVSKRSALAFFICNAAPALIEELEATREDVARYRWLCSDRWYIQVMRDLMDRHPKFCVIGIELDAAIDAARKESV